MLQNSLTFAVLLAILIAPYNLYGDQSPTAVGESKPDVTASFTLFLLTNFYIDCCLLLRAERENRKACSLSVLAKQVCGQK